MALENLTPSNRMEAILDGQDIEPSNRKEYFMQKAVSAGGSSLPSYSSSDIGKVLTVGEASVEAEVVVIPEQSVTITSETMMPGVIVNTENMLQDGASCDVLIDAGSYHAVAQASGSSVLVTAQIDATHEAEFRLTAEASYFAYLEETGGVYKIKPGTYTVSVSAVQSVTPTVQTIIAPLQTVTTADDGSYIEGNLDLNIDLPDGLPNTVTVNFNGVNYEVSSPDYGAPYVEEGYDFSEYPFYLFAADSKTCFLGTETAGTYTVSITASAPKAEPKWEAAGGGIFPVQASSQTGALDKTYSEISAAADSGLLPVIFATGIATGLSSPIFGWAVYDETYTVYAAMPANGTYVTLGKWSASSEDGTLTPVT